MEKELNIAAILKDKPAGTKLWSPIFGDCELAYICEKELEYFPIRVTKKKFGTAYFEKDGKSNKDGDCVLFPSKQMQDWSKFAWEKGDMLVNKDGDVYIIFERFADDTYCSFVGKYYLWKKNNDTELFYKNERLLTSDFQKAGKDAAQTYINTIEERLGGKLNLETLEIDQSKQEFKDGDIVYVKTKLGSEYIMINKLSEEVKIACYVAYNLSSKKIFLNRILSVCRDEEIGILRQVTDYEKSQLFDALAKKNKVWNAEKKQVVDLKIKWMALKPFDKVITRVDVNAIWTANIFSHIDSYGKYVTIGCVGGYPYCLPYNDETAHLIGTTDDWKGGEG